MTHANNGESPFIPEALGGASSVLPLGADERSSDARTHESGTPVRGLGEETDAALAAEARTSLEAAGCTGIRIQGGGDAWWVWASLASRDGVLHEACAYSARNPATPNDPVYLASSLLNTLRKNVAAHERGMGLDKPTPVEATAPVEAKPVTSGASEEPDMAQPININVAPVFNVTGGNATNTSDAERAAIAEVERMFDHGDPQPLGHALTDDDLGALDETPLPESEATDQPAEEIADSLSLGDDAAAAEGAEDLGSVDDGSASGGGALLVDDGSAQPGDSDFDYALDADFAEVGAELSEEDAAQLNTDFVRDPLLIEGAEIGLDVAATPEEPATGPIAYAASDLDALIREKLGRVSQIARELKAALQEGWTLEEFASLQNLIVRIDRKEAPDDEPARARFQAISERSQAMSRVDGHRDALEVALEDIGKSRDYAAAVEFDPEREWPYFG